jgi:MFS family permease
VAAPAQAVNWRRNLAALWLAEFTAIFGFSFAFPFIPVFLDRSLGIHDPHQLAFWSGIAGGASGFGLAIAAPVWGMLADRYGRRPMLLRSMAGGGITVLLMGISRTALELTGLRLLQGALSGTVAAATALVAAETPRESVAWALGILSSAIALGSAVGPAVGGLAGNVFGLRDVFFAGGVLLMVSTIPVFMMVRESRLRMQRVKPPPLREALRSSGPGLVRALVVIMVAQALLVTSYAATQQLIVLRLVALDPRTASGFTGLAFGLGGLTTALAGVGYSRTIRLRGYRPITVAASLAMTLSTLVIALHLSAPLIIAAFALVSLLYGALVPSLSSMIGLEAPLSVQATIFGLSASAVSIGYGAGPLLGGLAAAGAGIPAGIVLAAALALLLAAILQFGSREPVR